MATDGDFDESFFDAPAGHDSDAGDGGVLGSAPSTPVNSKRKRGPMNSPGTVNDEDEVARRRRRRQSLAFAQRRKSLTLNSSGSKQKGGDDAGTGSGGSSAAATGGTIVSRATSFARTTSSATSSNSRQYISDIYSTIIKMSSENKINVKNSWSLHLIDHMEDILGSSRKEDEDPDDTYNFQKASCTLDASIKIYSYRVDDTWNSSYKILENLSRTDDTGSKQQADSDDDGDPDESKSTRKAARKAHTAARTIEKNLNNINLKSYELEFEADPLFHKMSQSFDEGGAKGMLLANLGVYDGCKILLNSSDVSVSTRKPLEASSDVKKEENMAAMAVAPASANEAVIKTESSDPNKHISLASFGTLACFTEDVQAFEVCPPLSRLYKQLDEYYGDEAPQLKVKTTSEHLIKTPVKPKRLSINDATPVRARLDFDDMDDASQPMEVIEEVDEDAADDDMDVEMEDTEAGNDFEFGGGDDATGDDTVTGDVDASQVDGSQLADGGSSSQVLLSQVESEFSTQHEVLDVVDATVNAADFFKSRTAQSSSGGASFGRDDAAVYTMMIENALLRSAALGGDDGSGANDYSYFDVKMLRNWAGPAHWKFPAVRKVQSKQLKAAVSATAESSTAADELALMDVSDGEDDESGASKSAAAGAKTRGAKKPAGESKSVVIDFFAADEPDLTLSLKQPRTASAITMSKLMAKRHEQKAAELVFPVDSHVELGVFFQHFMKPKLRFFKKPQGHAPEQNDFVSGALDATYRRESDGVKFEDRRGGGGDGDDTLHANSGDYSAGDDYDYDAGTDDGDDELYSTEGLISASRVVEKVDVHYERFAKRVDVKKLKHNIWDHLEHETKLLGDDDAKAAQTNAEVDRLSDDFEAQTTIKETTTFESVVQSVSDRVPPDVTVSFYFICMLHLANEKGLELKGQDDLRNFTIRKEADDV